MTGARPDRPSVAGTRPGSGGSTWQRAAALEAGIWSSLARWGLRRPPRLAPGSAGFSYAAGAAPIMWVFIGMSAVEIPILHLLLPAGWWRVGALVLGAWGLLWMTGLLASLKMQPHEVGPDGIRIRYGTSTDVTVPWAVVESVALRRSNLQKSRAIQVEQAERGAVLQVVVNSQTTVVIILTGPIVVPLRRSPDPVVEIRIYADDPPGFVAAARGYLGRDAATTQRPTTGDAR